jgi:hypothetical protein
MMLFLDSVSSTKSFGIVAPVNLMLDAPVF